MTVQSSGLQDLNMLSFSSKSKPDLYCVSSPGPAHTHCQNWDCLHTQAMHQLQLRPPLLKPQFQNERGMRNMVLLSRGKASAREGGFTRGTWQGSMDTCASDTCPGWMGCRDSHLKSKALTQPCSEAQEQCLAWLQHMS